MSVTAGWLAHLRRDRALRSVPLWIVASALNTSFLVALLVLRARARSAAGGLDDPRQAAVLYLVIWLSVALYLSFGRVRSRCHELDLALPLSAPWRLHHRA